MHKESALRGLATFARSLLGRPALHQATSAARRGIASAGRGAKKTLGEWFAGPRGMFGKGVREAGRGMVTKPIQTMKKGFGEMTGGEKALMGGLGVLSAQEAAGKLEPGETRLGRIGANVGQMAGYLATPYKRVGMLGNILVGDVLGRAVGRQAGKLTSKITGVGGVAKPPQRYAAPGSMEAKWRS